MITEERRKETHTFYWGHHLEEQTWVAHIVGTITPVRPRKKTTGEKVTQVFYLEAEGREKVQVCQKMFLGTLGFNNDNPNSFIKDTIY